MYMHSQTSIGRMLIFQFLALLMYGVPVMVLTATATHDLMKCIALALGMYQCTVVL